MVQAIGSSAAGGAVDSGAGAAGLQAQLVRYQKQLSECANCASSKTAEGKAEIQAISGRISEIRARIDKVTEAKAESGPAALVTSTAAENPADSGAAVKAGADGRSDGVPRQVFGTVGSLVDLHA